MQTATAAVSQEAGKVWLANPRKAASAAAQPGIHLAMAAAVEPRRPVSINHVGDASQQAIAQAEDAGHARQGGKWDSARRGEINQIAQSVREVSAIIEQLDGRSERISG